MLIMEYIRLVTHLSAKREIEREREREMKRQVERENYI